jgi:3-methyladenine DNA glycosylase AlkD
MDRELMELVGVFGYLYPSTLIHDMSDLFVQNVVEVFRQHADPANAAPMAKYLRNKFDFFGIKTPLLRELSKPLLEASNLPDMDEVPHIVNDLWSLPQRELQHFGIELIRKYSRISPAGWIEMYQSLITQKSWWDTVDGLAVWHVGEHFRKYPDQIGSYTSQWMKSGNIWLQRTCLIFQLLYRGKTDFQLLQSFIVPLSGSKEFFIQKAIGWALRQYSRAKPEEVLDFVNRQPMAVLSYKEATRTICK